MEDYSKFQFKGFKIARSVIERNDKEASKKISLGFAPKGFIHKNDQKFQLQLGVKIEDENKSFHIEINAVANYHFENKEGLDNLGNFFYVNAPALLFPYIRAYISTLTNLSGFEPINLPTLNMTGLGEDLKNNTVEVE
ncbi:preprotein translocase subunit SecB [Saccharicrinis carchari]|uniref:Preprotein translocase subunit SecB n=1 Tax=Saccharicrinis carchari TaxID=1168039 RepID=A0A521E142_SACCC|nr:protein-export chaperone SecB [Saccharicrinis carchari]SMO77679.1 preprotein translocase subunit SecB [Saccharicrinis carchari]